MGLTRSDGKDGKMQSEDSSVDCSSARPIVRTGLANLSPLLQVRRIRRALALFNFHTFASSRFCSS